MKNLLAYSLIFSLLLIHRPAARRGWLALGDSYTIGQGITAGERYPIQAAELLRRAGVGMGDPDIVAATGWSTEELRKALAARPPAAPYEVVTLLIGVNNQYRGQTVAEYRARFAGLLQEAIRLAGHRPGHVVVLSIPDYSVTPFAAALNKQLISSEIAAFNEAAREVCRRCGVRWLDITGLSRQAAADPGLLAADGLHFSGRAYAGWAALLAPVLREAQQ